jgi:NDP-sugar pyrophosphorylase family protein
MSKGGLERIDVAILAGGLGTRIAATLKDTPKVLAEINGRPYLDHLLDWLAGFNPHRVVMCLGHLAQAVVTHLDGRPGIECVVEPEPLGTGGAVRFCREHLTSDDVMVMNGDTWLATDLAAFLQDHRLGGRDVSMMCVQVDDVSSYGKLRIEDRDVLEFVEKNPNDTSPGLINGGVYLMTQKALDQLCAAEARSIENDFFAVLAPGSIRAFVPEMANFIDIGTPERLAAARHVLPKPVDS